MGSGADITVLDLRKGVFALKDSWGAKRLAPQRLENAMTIRGGKLVYDRDGRGVSGLEQRGGVRGDPVKRAVALLALAAPLGAQEIYDILLKNGQVIDPANHRAGRYDVAVIGNKIAHVGHDLPAAHARIAIDASRYYVTPGLIDIRAHFDSEAGGRNLQPDHNCLPNGVTTAVLAGVDKEIAPAKTRLLAFVEPEHAAGMRDVVGILANDQNLDRALKGAEAAHTIIMFEGSDAKRLRPGDIQTHMYSRVTPFAPSMREARARGILFDVGGFWFRIAAPAIHQGFLPDTISTDIDTESVLLPRANMMTTLSKLINLGMTPEQAIARATVNAARAIRRPELGALSEGAVADIAVLEMEQGQFGFVDSGHGRLPGDRRLRCVLTVRNGAIVWDSDGLSAPDWLEAGP